MRLNEIHETVLANNVWFIDYELIRLILEIAESTPDFDESLGQTAEFSMEIIIRGVFQSHSCEVDCQTRPTCHFFITLARRRRKSWLIGL